MRENGASSGVGVLATYAYDDLGNRKSLTFGNGVVQAYTVDAVSRLAQLTNNLTGTINDLTATFAYNPASQIASTTRTGDVYAWTGHGSGTTASVANGLNQLTSIGGVATSHDARGNLTTDPTTAKTFAYSSENLLKSASGGVSLYYDPLLRLAEYDTTISTRFVYDGAEVAAEVDNPAGAIQHRYVRGDAADEVLVDYVGSGTTSRRFLSTDERGSVIALTDSSGAKIAIDTYDEYGKPGSGNSGRFQYTGQMWLPEVGAYNYKARFYSPTEGGRFYQTDPIGYAAGANWYAYAGNDPVNYVDPLGMSEEGQQKPDVPIQCTGDLCKTAVGGIYNGQVVQLIPSNIPDYFTDFIGTYYYDSNAQAQYVSFNPGLFGVSPYGGNGATGLAERGAGGGDDASNTNSGRCSGSVRTEGVHGSFILGLGITFGFGRATVNSSGEGQWYASFGFGAGFDLGVSGSASTYNGLSSVAGYNDNFNVSFPALDRTVGYSRAYDINDTQVATGVSATGLPGFEVGLSGSTTDTTLFGGRCG